MNLDEMGKPLGFTPTVPDINQTMPTDEELEQAYQNLKRTFFPAVDKIWEEFVRLFQEGHIPLESIEKTLRLFTPEEQADYRKRLGL